VASSTDRVLTVPNALSVLRLLCVPVFAWVLLSRHHYFAAACILAAIGATDWVDGQVARRFDQVSTLGKVLDPAADRVLVATAVVVGTVVGAIPVWLCVVVGIREAAVSGAVALLGALGAPRIDVVWAGKAGTLGLMFAFPLFLVGHSTVSWHSAAEVLAWAAAAAYVPAARRAYAQARLHPVP
jgi:cardiolipin synthase